MGSAIGPAFDYLMAGLPAALEAVDSSVTVAEAWPTTLSDDMFVLGRTSDADPEAEIGTHSITLLGGELVDEEFIIPFYIDCTRGGDDQSVVRNAALAYFDAFVKFLASDRTLGGALQNGRFARLDATRIDGNPMQGDAASVRRCVIQSSIRCQNQYSPFA